MEAPATADRILKTQQETTDEEEKVAVPDLTNMTPDEAQSTVKSLSLGLTKGGEEASDTVEEGKDLPSGSCSRYRSRSQHPDYLLCEHRTCPGGNTDGNHSYRPGGTVFKVMCSHSFRSWD